MIQDREETQAVKAVVVDNLEPYVRLIELQKQMIELVRQHEKTKGECAALREQLLDEMTRLRRRGWSWREIGRPVAARLKRLATVWHARKENQPPPDASFLSQNPALKI